MDCAICSSPMVNPAVGGGCAHHFCEECYVEWSERKASCPTCRAPVWMITRDAEYARVVGARTTSGKNVSTPQEQKGARPSTGDEHDELNRPRHIRLVGPAGLTIANSSQGGCAVVKVIKGNGGDLAGIRVGDIIKAVNGTEVRDHRFAVDFIERRCRVGDCEVELKSPTNWKNELRRHGSALLRRASRGSPLAHSDGTATGGA